MLTPDIFLKTFRERKTTGLTGIGVEVRGPSVTITLTSAEDLEYARAWNASKSSSVPKESMNTISISTMFRIADRPPDR